VKLAEMLTAILLPIVALLHSGSADDTQLKTPQREVLRFGDEVSAHGSWRDSRTGKRVGNVFVDQPELSEPFTSTIVCRRDTKQCTVAQTYSSNSTLEVSLNFFSVKVWTDREITAVKTSGCVTVTLRLRQPENSGDLRREVDERCRKNSHWAAAEFTLADGTAH